MSTSYLYEAAPPLPGMVAQVPAVPMPKAGFVDPPDGSATFEVFENVAAGLPYWK